MQEDSLNNVNNLYFAESVDRETLKLTHILRAQGIMERHARSFVEIAYVNNLLPPEGRVIERPPLPHHYAVPNLNGMAHFTRRLTNNISQSKHNGRFGNFSVNLLPSALTDTIPQKHQEYVINIKENGVVPKTFLVFLDLFTTGVNEPIGTVYAFNTLYCFKNEEDGHYITFSCKIIDAKASIEKLKKESAHIAHIVESLNLGTALRGGGVSPR